VTFLNLFISVRRSTCFRRFFRPSSGAQNCTYSVRYLSDRYCYLLLVLTFLNLFISVRRSTCFRRFFRQSSGAENCTYSVRYLSDQYLTLYVQSLKYFQNITNKMWRFSIYLFLYDALHVSDGFPSIIRSSKLHIQRQVFFRRLLLPAASLTANNR
jgi:hypothetical protein